MKRPTLAIFAVAVLCLLIGFSLGRRAGQPADLPPHAAPTAAPPAGALPPTAVAETVLAEVTRTPEPQPVEPPIGLASSLAQLNQALRQKFSVSMFGAQGRIEDDFAHIFQLTAGERNALDRYAEEARTRLGHIEAQHAVISEQGEETLEIRIPPLPEEGGALFTTFVAQVRSVLGEERFAALRQLSAHGLEAATRGRFGLSETTMELRPTGSSGSASSYWADGYTRIKVQTIPDILQFEYPAVYARLLSEERLKPRRP